MPEFDAGFFQENLGLGKWGKRPLSGCVSGFSNDTRKIDHGDCFIAIKTEKRDGHDYLEQAANAGAAMALVSECRPGVTLSQFVVPDSVAALQELGRSHRLVAECPVVGITGTAGKTSTKDLLALLLGDSAWKTQGNLNNTLGVPLTLLEIDPDTHTEVVIEAGISEGREMDVLADMIRPDVGIVTSVGPGHLDHLKTVEGVAQEKVKLLHAVEDGGLAIFPHTCLKFESFRKLDGRVWVTAPMDVEVDLPSNYELICYTTETRSKLHCGARLRVAGPANFIFEYILPEMSDGMVSNAVLAILAAQECGVSQADIVERLESWQPSTHRGQWVKMGKKRVYADCYNANPLSMLDAFRHFDQNSHLTAERLFIVGTMNELGEETERIHNEVGSKIPVGPKDRVVLIGPQAGAMAQGLAQRLTQPGQIIEVDEVGEIMASFHGFSGEVFLKASRSYHLEILLNTPVGEAVGAC